MAKAFINIGLARNDGHHNTFIRTLDMLQRVGIELDGEAVKHQSASEATLVAIIEYTDLTDAQIEEVCALLAQDCIAISPHEGGDKLVGPASELWGPFDPDQFILPSGQRLSEVL